MIFLYTKNPELDDVINENIKHKQQIRGLKKTIEKLKEEAPLQVFTNNNFADVHVENQLPTNLNTQEGLIRNVGKDKENVGHEDNIVIHQNVWSPKDEQFLWNIFPNLIFETLFINTFFPLFNKCNNLSCIPFNSGTMKFFEFKKKFEH